MLSHTGINIPNWWSPGITVVLYSCVWWVLFPCSAQASNGMKQRQTWCYKHALAVGYPDFDKCKICTMCHNAINHIVFWGPNFHRKAKSIMFTTRDFDGIVKISIVSLVLCDCIVIPWVKHHVILKVDSVTTELYSYLKKS